MSERMPQRILIHSINYAPELTGIGKYTGEMGQWLVEHGFEVRVITAPPYYPAWRVTEGYATWWYRSEIISGAHVCRCPLWVPERPSGVSRIVHLATFAITSFPVMLWNALTWRPDIVFVVEPPFFCAPAAWISARIARATAWLHIQDFELDAAYQLGILRSGFVRTLLSKFEKWMLCRYDRVSTISERMLEKLEDKGVGTQRRLLFPNWVDINQIRPLVGSCDFRTTLNIPEGTFVLLYSGNMGKKQGLEILVEVARLMSDRQDILLLFCGDGAVRNELTRMSDGLPNVRFIPLQPAELLNELLNAADVHLLPQRADAEDLVMPSKLTGMLASGRPVVATARPGTQVANIVSQCGIVVDPGDVLGLKDAILTLADDQQRRTRMGEAGRKFAVENWNREKILQQVFAQ